MPVPHRRPLESRENIGFGGRLCVRWRLYSWAVSSCMPNEVAGEFPAERPGAKPDLPEGRGGG